MTAANRPPKKTLILIPIPHPCSFFLLFIPCVALGHLFVSRFLFSPLLSNGHYHPPNPNPTHQPPVFYSIHHLIPHYTHGMNSSHPHPHPHITYAYIHLPFTLYVLVMFSSSSSARWRTLALSFFFFFIIHPQRTLATLCTRCLRRVVLIIPPPCLHASIPHGPGTLSFLLTFSLIHFRFHFLYSLFCCDYEAKYRFGWGDGFSLTANQVTVVKNYVMFFNLVGLLIH